MKRKEKNKTEGKFKGGEAQCRRGRGERAYERGAGQRKEG